MLEVLIFNMTNIYYVHLHLSQQILIGLSF